MPLISIQQSVFSYDKRETVWNEIDEQGQLKINVGRIKVVQPLIVKSIEQCVRSQTKIKKQAPARSTHLKSERRRLLILNSQHWIDQEQLDFPCVQKLCAMRGGSCFMTRMTNIPQRAWVRYFGGSSVSVCRSACAIGALKTHDPPKYR